MREVGAHDLELFAINSGELYERHKALGRGDSMVDWIEHVRNRVRPLYCRQVERVAMTDDCCFKVAAALKTYYERHVREI